MNPFSPPQHDQALPPPLSYALLRERRRLLQHELTIKGLGGLCVLCGILLFLGLGLFIGLPHSVQERMWTGSLAIVAGLLITSGVSLRQLYPIGRQLYLLACTLGAICTMISMVQSEQWLSFLIPLLLAAIMPIAFAGVLCSTAGRKVLSQRYREEVVPHTPGMRIRKTVWFWTAFAVTTLLAALGAFVVLSSYTNTVE